MQKVVKAGRSIGFQDGDWFSGRFISSGIVFEPLFGNDRWVYRGVQTGSTRSAKTIASSPASIDINR